MLEDKQSQQLYRTIGLHELWARTNLPGKAQCPQRLAVFYRHPPDQAALASLYATFDRQLARRRHLVSEVCMVHLNTAFEAVFKKLEAVAQAEQRRQAGIRRKRFARQRAREAAAAPPGP